MSQSLYNTIFTRRAVRNYDRTSLDENTLNDIYTFLQNIRQLPGQQADFEILPGHEVKNSIAPHYLIAYCESNSSAHANVGFFFQHADLYLQSIGLGSLWVGATEPKNPKENYCIAIAFGKTDVPARTSVADFSRLPMKDISNEDNSIAAAARLAPSAANFQPWKFQFGEDKVEIKYFGRGPFKALPKLKLMNKLDVGIAAYHMVLAIKHEGKDIISVVPISQGKEFKIEITYH